MKLIWNFSVGMAELVLIRLAVTTSLVMNMKNKGSSMQAEKSTGKSPHNIVPSLCKFAESTVHTNLVFFLQSFDPSIHKKLAS